MAEGQESTTTVGDNIPLTGDHSNDLSSETMIFHQEPITSSLSSAGPILPQDLMAIQSLDSNNSASAFTVGGVTVSSNAGTTTTLQSEIGSISQADAMAVTEYQLVDSGNGELIMVTSSGQKGIEIAGIHAGQTDQGQTITLSLDQLLMQQQGLNRTVQMPDGSLQILNPSLVQVEKEDGTIEAQEISLEVLQALQGEYLHQMPPLTTPYNLVESEEPSNKEVEPKSLLVIDPKISNEEEKAQEEPAGIKPSSDDTQESEKGNDRNKETEDEMSHTETQSIAKDTISQGKSNKETAEKVPDLNSPIPLTDQTVVMIKGKKCILAFNEETQQVCAYPVKPPPGAKKRGRPKLSAEEREKVAGRKRQQKELYPEDELSFPSEKSTAAETLLELSSVGADGIRRSARKRRKARLFEEYEELDDSDEEAPFVDNQDKDPDINLNLSDDRRRKSLLREEPLSVLPTPPTAVKRGRGRPRRYPPPGQSQTPTSIPAVIIPSPNGQTLVMTSIANLQNLSNFQRQLPNLIPKPSLEIAPTSTASVPGESTDNNTLSLGGEPDTLPLDTSEALDSNTMIPTALQGDTIPLVGNEGDNIDQADALDNSGNLLNFTQQRADKSKEDAVSQNSDQLAQTAMIQIPDNLLPMLGIKSRDPVKIGLKSSEKELEKLKCPKCDFQCFYNQQYRTHIATHGDDIHKCKCCSYVSLESDELLAHFKEFHPRCICLDCDFMAEHAYIIKRHMMRHNAKSCTCHVCGKVYKDMYILKMHVKMVHMPPEVLFECNVCAKKFTRKAHLKRHLRIHEPEKPFKCPHCDYRGCERSDISKHMLIHEEPKHVCERCGKTFRHIKNKELHVKRHYGQRDYKCGVCEFFGYTFTDIRKHIERKHQDIKTLICDKCNKQFKSDLSLKEHQQVCNVMMIEQILAIPTSAGGTSQATIQIPTIVGPDGQQIILDGQNIAVDGQGVSAEGHVVSVNGQTISLEKPGGVNIMVADQPLGGVGVDGLEDDESSINQAMQIIGQTIMTEDGEELHIIENPNVTEAMVGGQAGESQQRVVLLHQGIDNAQLGSGETSQIQMGEEFISQEVKQEVELSHSEVKPETLQESVISSQPIHVLKDEPS